MWSFLAYLSILHVAVCGDDQGVGNQGDFKAPSPFLQAQYQHFTNLSTNGSDEISTDSPLYTSQQIFISSKATEKMSVANFTKPRTTQALTEEKTMQGLTKTITLQGLSKLTTRGVTNTESPTVTKSPLSKTTEVQTLMTKVLSNYTMETTTKTSISNLSGVSTVSIVSSKSAVTENLSSKNISTTQTTEYTVSDFNSTEELYNSTVDPSRLARTFADDFQSRDSFWPIALALTIGIPTIVVLAVTITVLYRGRMAKPRSLLAMYGQEYY